MEQIHKLQNKAFSKIYRIPVENDTVLIHSANLPKLEVKHVYCKNLI